MKLTLMPLQSTDVIRVRCEGLVSLRHLGAEADPLRDLLGADCFGLKVLLNLEKAEGIDTSGVSWLLRSFNKFRDAGGDLVLYSVPPIVLTVLDFLRLRRALAIAANESAARELSSAEGDNGVGGNHRASLPGRYIVS